MNKWPPQESASKTSATKSLTISPIPSVCRPACLLPSRETKTINDAARKQPLPGHPGFDGGCGFVRADTARPGMDLVEKVFSPKTGSGQERNLRVRPGIQR